MSLFRKLFLQNPLQKAGVYGIISPLFVKASFTSADVAQLVEQLIRNQQVAGSSPAISSKIPRIRVGFLLFTISICIAVRTATLFTHFARYYETDRPFGDPLPFG